MGPRGIPDLESIGIENSILAMVQSAGWLAIFVLNVRPGMVVSLPSAAEYSFSRFS